MKGFCAGLMVGIGLLSAACSDSHARQVAEADRLLKADQAFAQASLDGGTPSAFFAYLQDSAIQLPANGSPVEGRGAIRDHLVPLGIHVLAWNPRRAEVSESLDLGWTWGDWRLLASARSGEVLSRGKYLNVWRRDPDGQWKVLADIGNEEPLPDAAPAEDPPVDSTPAEAAPPSS